MSCKNRPATVRALSAARRTVRPLTWRKLTENIRNLEKFRRAFWGIWRQCVSWNLVDLANLGLLEWFLCLDSDAKDFRAGPSPASSRCLHEKHGGTSISISSCQCFLVAAFIVFRSKVSASCMMVYHLSKKWCQDLSKLSNLFMAILPCSVKFCSILSPAGTVKSQPTSNTYTYQWLYETSGHRDHRVRS